MLVGSGPGEESCDAACCLLIVGNRLLACCVGPIEWTSDVGVH